MCSTPQHLQSARKQPLRGVFLDLLLALRFGGEFHEQNCFCCRSKEQKRDFFCGKCDFQTTSDVEKGNRETAENKKAQHATMQKAGIKPEKTSDWVGNSSVFFSADQDKLDKPFHPKKKLTAMHRPLAKEPPISAHRPVKMLKLGNERNALRSTPSQHGQDKTEHTALHKKKPVAKDPPNFDNLPFKILKDSKVEEHPDIKVLHREPTQTFDERKHRGPPLMMPGIKHAVQGVVPVV